MTGTKNGWVFEMSVETRDVYTVHVAGEDENIEVHNVVNGVGVPFCVRGFNPVAEEYPEEAPIWCGFDGREKPDAVTAEVARALQEEVGIDVEKREDIRVVDVESEEVTVL